jgi:tRNA threonylcarbamoyladenosine biosynthesis protein TsaE
MKIAINSPQAMFELGEKIGQQLKPSDVVVLTGQLGAGKTVLTQGIASAFNIRSYLTNLCNQSYSQRGSKFHPY